MANELGDIEEVRNRAKVECGSCTMDQASLKAILPPGCSVWNNWRGRAWRLTLRGHGHDHEPWFEQGRDASGLALVARAWRTWLEDAGLSEEMCPVIGLLDTF